MTQSDRARRALLLPPSPPSDPHPPSPLPHPPSPISGPRGAVMVRFLLVRLLHGAAVLVGVATLVFVLIHLSGDPLSGLLPPGSSPQQIAAIRHQYGLDRPLLVQYESFLTHATRGDFGDSWRQGRPALTAVFDRLPATLLLAAAAIVLALLIGVPLGLLAGARPGGVSDLAATGVALAGQAVPGFWLGTLLILVFAVHLRWLPSSGGVGPASLLLPALTLAAYPAAIIARLLRTSLADTLDQDYLRTARAKGVSDSAVLMR